MLFIFEHTVTQVNPVLVSTIIHIKLPATELINFDGNPRHWQTYINMFDSRIHTNDSISNNDKFNI